MKTVYCSFIRVKETSIKRNLYFSVKINEIPRFALNDRTFVVFAVVRGRVGGNAANPAPNNSLFILNSLSF
jgi:hypothetical protein